jgi:hypothetical protein
VAVLARQLEDESVERLLSVVNEHVPSNYGQD